MACTRSVECLGVASSARCRSSPSGAHGSGGAEFASRVADAPRGRLRSARRGRRGVGTRVLSSKQKRARLDLRAAARSSTRPTPSGVRHGPVRSEERRETPFQTMASIARVGLHLGGAGPWARAEPTPAQARGSSRVRDGPVPAEPGLGPCGAWARLDDERPEPHRYRSMKRRLERTRVGWRQKLDTAAASGGSSTWSLP